MIIKNAYGKINFTLEIIGKNINGLHKIKSIMQSISLHDTLIFIERKDSNIILKTDCKELPIDETNLIIKSAKWLQLYANCKKGVTIDLKKIIPISAGLAGGSSDAAATILALNDLWKLNIPIGKLVSLSIAIGSDVPFLILGGTCLVEGVGEKVTPINLFTSKKILLVKPNIKISTKTIYDYYDKYYDKFILINKSKKTTQNFINIVKKCNKFDFYCFNYLEPVVFELFPKIKKLIKSIEKNKCKVLITGSGSGFIVMGDSIIINNIYNNLRDKKLFVKIIHTL